MPPRGGRLAKPTLPDGPLKDLNDSLHELLRRAGGPSLRVLETDIRLGKLLPVPPSHTRIYDVFVKDRIPDCDLLLCLVQVIAERVHKLDPSLSPNAEGEHFYRLWLAADEYDRQEATATGGSYSQLADGFSIFPIYLLAEESAAMAGTPVAVLNESIAELYAEIASNPVVADKARFCLIGFSDQARVLSPLSDISGISAVPNLAAKGHASYGPAFNLLRTTIDQDARELRMAGYKVLRPAVFFLTGSQPMDPRDWPSAYERATNSSWRYHPNILAFGFGSADEGTVRRVATVRAFFSSEIRIAYVLREYAQSLANSITQSGASAGRAAGARLVIPDELPGFTIIDVDTV